VRSFAQGLAERLGIVIEQAFPELLGRNGEAQRAVIASGTHNRAKPGVQALLIHALSQRGENIHPEIHTIRSHSQKIENRAGAQPQLREITFSTEFFTAVENRHDRRLVKLSKTAMVFGCVFRLFASPA
jgi:hypothetical protein